MYMVYYENDHYTLSEIFRTMEDFHEYLEDVGLRKLAELPDDFKYARVVYAGKAPEGHQRNLELSSDPDFKHNGNIMDSNVRKHYYFVEEVQYYESL